ncbi:amidohydrolase [Weissella coleopterorum]|uniref:6-methylsalicylate decarboxylase n=1 Tax=Weissella coleopterorum TaxID=2714949 RepID=A0A6G8AZE8_9LACO|nr:amidohydrolase family protein [Weissella coleopterorum]QIL50335.1 amidohydrolase [Weissella coleopterorum]
MTNKIDFHTHFLPEVYVDYLNKYYDGKADGVRTPKWSLEEHLQFMKDSNIDHSVLSLSSPHPSLGNQAETIAIISAINEEAEKISRTFPEKFSYSASLPLPFIDESLKTIERFADTALGFSFPSNTQGLYLGDPKLDDVMALLNEKKATIFIHPTEPQEQNIDAAKGIKTPLMEFFFDTTRAVVNLAQFQIFSRYPAISWIIPHAGALLPIIAQRISEGNKFLSAPTDPQPDDLLQVMQQKNVHFDLAGMVLPYQLPTLLQIVKPDQLLYGSDFPYTPAATTDKLAQKIEDTSLFSSSELNAIFNENAGTILTNQE